MQEPPCRNVALAEAIRWNRVGDAVYWSLTSNFQHRSELKACYPEATIERIAATAIAEMLRRMLIDGALTD